MRGSSESLYGRIMAELRQAGATDREPEVWRRAMTRCGGSVQSMSRWLGVSRAWVYVRLARFELRDELRTAQEAKANNAAPDHASRTV